MEVTGSVQQREGKAILIEQWEDHSHTLESSHDEKQPQHPTTRTSPATTNLEINTTTSKPSTNIVAKTGIEGQTIDLSSYDRQQANGNPCPKSGICSTNCK